MGTSTRAMQPKHGVAQMLAAVACLPTIAVGFAGLSPMRSGPAASFPKLRPMLDRAGSKGRSGPSPHAGKLQRAARCEWKATVDSAGMMRDDISLDEAESVALEQLSSILETDDGLRLSGAEMRDARSNWVRDIMSTGSSRVLSKVSPRLSVSMLVAITVAVISNWSPEGSWWLELFQVPGWPHELVGGFLAILLVFRTDQAYGRFWEGRTLWATMAAELRSLTRVTVSNRELLSPQALDEVLAHLSAYPVLSLAAKAPRAQPPLSHPSWAPLLSPHSLFFPPCGCASLHAYVHRSLYFTLLHVCSLGLGFKYFILLHVCSLGLPLHVPTGRGITCMCMRTHTHARTHTHTQRIWT